MYAEPGGASLAAELASGLALMETDRLSYDRVFELMGREPAMTRDRCAALGVDTLSAQFASTESGSNSRGSWSD
jgi:hypothetical protein